MTHMVESVATEAARQRSVAEYRLAGPDAWEVPDQQLIDLAGRAQRILGAEYCAINILDELCQWSVSSSIEVPVSVSARAFSICQRVLSQAAFEGGVFVTSDASKHPMLADNIWVNGDAASIRFYACAPLTTPTGLALGTACAWGEQEFEIGARERTELRAFSTAVMDLLDQRRIPCWEGRSTRPSTTKPSAPSTSRSTT
jgi:GAF domain-containing protein